MSPLHVVVVGHGMVGARFAEEVRRHDPEGRRVRLTVLAAEPRPAYNRVLLPNLLSGVMKEEDFATTVVAGFPVLTGEEKRSNPNGSVLPPDAPMTLRLRSTVIGIDQERKTVLVRSAGTAGPAAPSTRDRARAATRARNEFEAGTEGAARVETGAGPEAGARARAAVADGGATAGTRALAWTVAEAGNGAVERISYDILVLATGARAAVPSLPGLLAREDGHAASSPPPLRAAPSSPAGPAASAANRAREGEKDVSGAPGLTAAGSAWLTPADDQSADAGNGSRGGEARSRSDDRLSPDVAVLHSLADGRRVAAFAQAARRTGGRIAVLGGGVLGLEAARALAARGTAVTVVHRGAYPMDRQLDAPAGRVLAAAMRRTGVAVSLGAGAAWWESGQGLWLADGQLVRASGLVLCTGTVPCTELAQDAGLRLTESGAVAVDDTLATSAPGIYAIGDCAGHPGAAGGLVQPGWEQAAVLASRLTGVSPKARYRGSGAVTRLKAAGIELTAVGATATEPADDGDVELLRFEDPVRERYAKLVLSADRVVGAIMIGLPDAAAGVVQLYDRDAPVPTDRLALLLGRALPPEPGGGSGPAALPDYAVVCRCNMVTKGQLRDAWYGGACGRAALSAATRAATGCGTCGDDLDAVSAWLAQTDPSQAATQDTARGARADPHAHPSRDAENGQPADPREKEAALQ